MIAAIIGISLLAFIALIIANASHVDTGKGIWVSVYVLPGIGLPIGILLMIALVIVSARRRSKEARAEQEAAAIAARPVPPVRVQPKRNAKRK
jgi:hypothetical protein